MSGGAFESAGNPDPDRSPQRIQLVKNAQRWIITVDTESERRLPEALIELVAASEGELDWFDAAVMCLEIEARRVR